MLFSKNRIQTRLLTCIATIFSISLLTASASLEQLILPINENNKKLTFTFYHFNSSKTASLQELNKNIGNTASSLKASAAISATANTTFSYQSGKFHFSKTTTYFIQDGKLSSSASSTGLGKHTLILTNGKGNHAIAYTPNVNGEQLAYALKNYLASHPNFTTAIVVGTGNQCGFYKNNGKYNPYYLKELKKPSKVIIIK